MTFQAVPENILATPLHTLDAVAFDTETTGTDPGNDRIIEIAAVRMASGRIKEDDTFSILLNPGIPIPARATSIHGIVDSDVQNAEGFASGIRKFTAWTGPSLLIGYSVWFDLAFLEAEHKRHGLNWLAPRALDLQALVQAQSPEFPDSSLETVAERMGIAVRNRHRALPDAIVTARVLTGIVPALRKRQITTFSEAERRSVTDRGKLGDVRQIEYARPAESMALDSYPFRKRIGDIMTPDPSIADPEVALEDVIGIMARDRIGSVFLAPREDRGFGIISERDVITAVHEHGASALARPAGDFCTWPVLCMPRKEFVYRAIVEMSKNHVRHLGITGDDGRIIGIVSARDFYDRQTGNAISLGKEIETADRPEDLGRIWSGLAMVAKSLATSNIDSRQITAIISRELRALSRRACEIAETELVAEGHGNPPARYAYFVLGSGGRGESMLAMDQDNGIVFENGKPEEAVDNWLGRLATRTSEILDLAGVAYCQGGVMASNADWRKDLAGWKASVERWVRLTSPDDLMHADIFFDAMPVYGDHEVADKLLRESIQIASAAKPFLNLLATRACNFDSPFGWFGRWISKDGRIDLKKCGLMPIFSAARTSALGHGIAARSTSARMKAASKAGNLPENLVEDLSDAHRILLGTVIQQQLRDISEGIRLSNTVMLRELDAFDQQQVKWALEQVPRIADLLGKPAAI